MAWKIVLADDHKVIREGLHALIDREGNMEVVAETADGRSAVSLAEKHNPDLVIMDVALPELNGIEATRQILKQNGKTRIIALSMHSDRRYVIEMLRAGASAYLVKTADFSELLKAIRCVLNNQRYLSPEITSTVIEDYLRGLPEEESAAAELSPKQREVLQLLAEGYSVKQIAKQLHVSEKTVHTHRQNIMEKTGVSSMAGLTKYAIREGLTQL